jgi:hypothetical protein
MRFAVVLAAALALAFSLPAAAGAGKRAKRRSAKQRQSGAVVDFSPLINSHSYHINMPVHHWLITAFPNHRGSS